MPTIAPGPAGFIKLKSEMKLRPPRFLGSSACSKCLPGCPGSKVPSGCRSQCSEQPRLAQCALSRPYFATPISRPPPSTPPSLPPCTHTHLEEAQKLRSVVSYNPIFFRGSISSQRLLLVGEPRFSQAAVVPLSESFQISFAIPNPPARGLSQRFTAGVSCHLSARVLCW